MEIGERYGWVIDTLATDGNHVHVFMGALPRYPPADVVKIMKHYSARDISGLSTGEKRALGKGDLGRWLLCRNSRE
jgi:putative transposase